MIAAGLGLSHFFTEESVVASPVNPMKVAASDRVNLGVIGTGTQGPADLRDGLTADPNIHCIAFCDVDKTRLDTQTGNFKKDFPDQTKQLQQYSDFRKLLENKDIDGVIIAVPDHSHTYIFSEAIKAGKAIYIEKPVANSIAECNKMMELQAKYKAVITTGLWQTSIRYFRLANDLLKTGILGDVFKVHVFLCQSTNPRAAVADEPAPSTIDYEMWLGPAPSRPYNSGRVRGWRSFWDYGGGQQTDWGVHWIDSAFDGIKALGRNDITYPKSVFSVAQKHPDSFNETPSCQSTIYEYDNFQIEWTQQVANLYNRDQGVAWIGSRATLVCNRVGYQLIPQRSSQAGANANIADAAELSGVYGGGGLAAHMVDWANCIRTKNIQTASPVEKGAFATILAHQGNIAFRTGTKVVYDPKTQKFVNNAAADAYLRPAYRKPWDSMWG